MQRYIAILVSTISILTQLQLVSLIYLKGTYGINIVQFGDAALAILNMYCTMYCT